MAQGTTTERHRLPFFGYDDAQAAIDWLEQAFGFERGEVHEVTTARSCTPSSGSGRRRDARLGERLRGRRRRYVVVEDVDALYARAKAAGAEIVREVADTDYGSRDYIVRDPEGRLWAFGTYQASHSSWSK